MSNRQPFMPAGGAKRLPFSRTDPKPPSYSDATTVHRNGSNSLNGSSTGVFKMPLPVNNLQKQSKATADVQFVDAIARVSTPSTTSTRRDSESAVPMHEFVDRPSLRTAMDSASLAKSNQNEITVPIDFQFAPRPKPIETLHPTPRPLYMSSPNNSVRSASRQEISKPETNFMLHPSLSLSNGAFDSQSRFRTAEQAVEQDQHRDSNDMEVGREYHGERRHRSPSIEDNFGRNKRARLESVGRDQESDHRYPDAGQSRHFQSGNFGPDEWGHYQNGQPSFEQSAQLSGEHVAYIFGEDAEEHITEHMPGFEEARRRWAECPMEEWVNGADEIMQKFTDIMDLVRDHMRHKMSLYQKVQTRMSSHSQVLDQRDKLLRDTKERLMQQAGNVGR